MPEFVGHLANPQTSLTCCLYFGFYVNSKPGSSELKSRVRGALSKIQAGEQSTHQNGS